MLAFFNQLGTTEIILILFVVLLLFGAKKLPELAKGMGKSLGEFKKARKEFEHEIEKTKNTIEATDSTEEKK